MAFYQNVTNGIRRKFLLLYKFIDIFDPLSERKRLYYTCSIRKISHNGDDDDNEYTSINKDII
jgi:hypothetical protein